MPEKIEPVQTMPSMVVWGDETENPDGHFEVLRHQVRAVVQQRNDERLEQVAEAAAAAARACVLAGATAPDDIAKAVGSALAGPQTFISADGRRATGGFYAR